VYICKDVLTKHRVPPVRVSPKGEDVGVVCRDHSQSVQFAGQLGRLLDGPVELHGLGEGPTGPTVVVSMVDSPPWKPTGENSSPPAGSLLPLLVLVLREVSAVGGMWVSISSWPCSVSV